MVYLCATLRVQLFVGTGNGWPLPRLLTRFGYKCDSCKQRYSKYPTFTFTVDIVLSVQSECTVFWSRSGRSGVRPFFAKFVSDKTITGFSRLQDSCNAQLQVMNLVLTCHHLSDLTVCALFVAVL